jgi:nucleotide-binding universal stress UspA family protein
LRIPTVTLCITIGFEIPIMFEHILVPVRLGGTDGPLLEPALGLAKLSQAEVTLLHVVEKVAGTQSTELRSFHKQLADKAEIALTRATKTFSREGIPVRTAVLIGSAAVEIVRYASGHGVDLIVMGSHSVQTDQIERGWGTTSYKVGLMCQCPVFLVKDLKSAPKRRAPATQTRTKA